MPRPRPSSAGRLVLVFLVALAPAACGGGAGAGSAGEGPGADGRSTEELEALFEARTDSARMRFSEADVRFMTGMIAHHTQALVMARLAPERAASPQIETLAARIINAQQDEIATMERWLRGRDQPVPEIEIDGLELEMPASLRERMPMPGMLSREQLEELEAASGREFDRRFLELMIEHHQGAVTMVHELFRTDGAAQGDTVFRLASDIQVDQRTEIQRMRRMLDEMAADGSVGR